MSFITVVIVIWIIAQIVFKNSKKINKNTNNDQQERTVMPIMNRRAKMIEEQRLRAKAYRATQPDNVEPNSSSAAAVTSVTDDNLTADPSIESRRPLTETYEVEKEPYSTDGEEHVDKHYCPQKHIDVNSAEDGRFVLTASAFIGQELLQGIVMSEILGPCRARRRIMN